MIDILSLMYYRIYRITPNFLHSFGTLALKFYSQQPLGAPYRLTLAFFHAKFSVIHK